MQKALANLNKDADGKLSAAEFNRGPKIFQRLDKNGDGFLDENEFKGAGVPAPKATPKAAEPTEVTPELGVPR